MIERGLNPVLIGHNLYYIYHAKNIKTKTKSKYLVLVLRYDGDGRKYSKPYMLDKMHLLINSLKLYTMLDSRERFFLETRITINFRDTMYNDYYYTNIT
jgi:hypothetical protein